VVAKKTIFEKLGLIEPIEEDGVVESEVLVGAEESKKTEEIKPKESKIEEPVVKEEEPVSFGMDLLAVKNDVASEERFALLGGKEENIKEEATQIEDKLDVLIGSYEKNKMMSIDDIYRTGRMEADKKKTIFMVDVFQKTLPENLPIDVKRASVMNIMDVSAINLENLLNDAYKRIDTLNNVLEETVQTTEDVFAKNTASISELENRIKELRKVVDARQRFQEDQTSVIEYEIQKIIGIVDFIKPKK